MNDAATEPDWPSEAGTLAEPAPSGGRLDQPWRAAVTFVEVVLAAVAVWGAFAVWQGGGSSLVTRLTDGTELVSHKLSAGNVAGAIGLGALAALLIVDAVRQLFLGVRANGKRRSRHGKQ